MFQFIKNIYRKVSSLPSPITKQSNYLLTLFEYIIWNTQRCSCARFLSCLDRGLTNLRSTAMSRKSLRVQSRTNASQLWTKIPVLNSRYFATVHGTVCKDLEQQNTPKQYLCCVTRPGSMEDYYQENDRFHHTCEYHAMIGAVCRPCPEDTIF